MYVSSTKGGGYQPVTSGGSIEEVALKFPTTLQQRKLGILILNKVQESLKKKKAKNKK
jgi:hypothetical protein